MTTQAFKSPKRGDRVYIPSSRGPQEAVSTEVLAIDRLFGKVTVLLGRKPYSYRYVRKEPSAGWTTGLTVGMCDFPQS